MREHSEKSETESVSNKVNVSKNKWNENRFGKKRLLITGSTFPRYLGDTEPRFLLDLAKALLPYYDVTVLAPGAPDAKSIEILEGVKVKRYQYFPIKSLQTLCYPGAIVPRIKEKKSRALLVPWLFGALYFNLFHMRKDFDIVHANWLIPQGIVQSFVSTPYVVTGHGGDVTSLNKGIFRLLKKRCIRKASYVTAVSEHLMKKVNEVCHNENTAILSMGCNTELFGRQYRKFDFFQQNNKKVILFVGRLAEKKGVTYLIEAMKQVDAILVIVGDGPLRENLKFQARTLGEKVRFAGAKTHEELRDIYASADIFAAPSVTAADGDQEGFGLVILEAMASGLAVVASNSGGITDLIEDNKNGLLTVEKNSDDIAKKLHSLCGNDILRHRLSVEAQKTAAKYDYKEIARKYAEIFKSCLN